MSLPKGRRSTTSKKFFSRCLAAGMITLGLLLLACIILSVRAEGTVAAYASATSLLTNVPEPLRTASVAMEDGNFYRHSGVDWEAIRRAAEVNVRCRRITQGGSTITQQLAKNLFLTHERTFTRKIQEMFLAKSLEHHFTKGQILTLYIRSIPYGMKQIGAENAIRYYFDKTPSQANLAEVATLVSLVPRNAQEPPSVKSLRTGRNVALARIAYWFPGHFSDAALQRAKIAKIRIWSGSHWLIL